MESIPCLIENSSRNVKLRGSIRAKFSEEIEYFIKNHCSNDIDIVLSIPDFNTVIFYFSDLWEKDRDSYIKKLCKELGVDSNKISTKSRTNIMNSYYKNSIFSSKNQKHMFGSKLYLYFGDKIYIVKCNEKLNG